MTVMFDAKHHQYLCYLIAVLSLLLGLPLSTEAFALQSGLSSVARLHGNHNVADPQGTLNSSGAQFRTSSRLMSHSRHPREQNRRYGNDDNFGGDSGQGAIEKCFWLHQATLNLLDQELYPLGSLEKGKWHELQSMLVSWSKCINTDSHKDSSSWAKSGIFENAIDMPLFLESILKRLIDERASGNEDVRITTQMYNTVINAWLVAITQDGGKKRKGYSKSSGGLRVDGATCLMAAQRSLDIVKYMQSTYEMDVESKGEGVYVKPNYHSFLMVLKILTRACHVTSIPPDQSKHIQFHKASNKAHQTLLWMEYLSRKGRNSDAKPNVLCYTLVMDAYAKSGELDAGTKAERVMRHMQAMESDDPSMKPNRFCYNLVINAYTRQGRRGGAVDNAERILVELENIYEETEDIDLKPDVISYTTLVTAWANGNRRGYGANRAEEILNRMLEVGTPPNKVTYNAVLKSWCRSGDKRASDRALNIFKRMKEESSKNGNTTVQPDRITYNTLIHTLSKSGDVGALNHAEKILEQMHIHKSKKGSSIAPNRFSYNTIIEGWSKVRNKEGALRAYSLLQRLLEYARAGSGVFPDIYSFNNVIFALSKSNINSAPTLAEDILQYMEREYDAGNIDFQPDIFGYSAAIHAWANSGATDAGYRAEALLQRLGQRYAAGKSSIRPNTVTYNSVIDCWAKSGQGVIGVRKSEEIVRKMNNLYEKGDVSAKPTSSTYNSLLLAWANSDTKCAPRICQYILNHMWKQYEEGNRDMKPNELTYNTVINAMSKSPREDKAQQALRILRKMDKLYQAGNKDARPSTHSYTSVLNSCAFSTDCELVRKKALDTAIFTFEELKDSPYGKPNHVTYGMFLRAVSNLIPTDDELRRRSVVEPVFLQCCKDGQVGEIVLKQLRYAAPEDLYQKLIGDFLVSSKSPTRGVRIEDIPHAWKCNVRNERRGARRNNGKNKMRRGKM